LKESGHCEKGKSNSSAGFVASAFVPWLDPRRLCSYLQRHHCLGTRWTVPKGGRWYQDIHCWNGGCAARTVPHLNNAYQDCLLHGYCNTSDFSHTYAHRLGDDHTVKNSHSSLKSNCIKPFRCAHGNEDAHSHVCIHTKQYAIFLRPQLHTDASSKRNRYSTYDCSYPGQDGYSCTYQHSATANTNASTHTDIDTQTTQYNSTANESTRDGHSTTYQPASDESAAHQSTTDESAAYQSTADGPTSDESAAHQSTTTDGSTAN
jgi:hypothetical protein